MDPALLELHLGFVIAGAVVGAACVASATAWHCSAQGADYSHFSIMFLMQSRLLVRVRHDVPSQTGSSARQVASLRTPRPCRKGKRLAGKRSGGMCSIQRAA